MVDIIIVNWNSGARLGECIESVRSSGESSVGRVLVVDNASTDGSAKSVEGLNGVHVISADENLGFAAACNIGAKEASARYLLFLNPDTRLDLDSLAVPYAFMERPSNAQVGICGIQLSDGSGGVSRNCARFPTLGRFVLGALGISKLPRFRGAAVHMLDWDHTRRRRVDHVIGAFFLIRRDVFVELGGFDERFFLYLEDLDFSLRASQAGWKSMYLAEAQAFHAGGGTSRQVKAHRLFYSLRSRLLYGFKHFPQWQAWVLVGVTGILEPVTRTAWCLARGDAAGVRHTWFAYRMLWCGMGKIARGEGRFAP